MNSLGLVFFRVSSGREPVREWLKGLSKKEQVKIGEDIKAAQLRWPLVTPKVKKLDKRLWEVRSKMHRRIARVLFTVQEEKMILLHGFIKKTQKTPGKEIDTAHKRLRHLESS